jgi:hypothetical protein
MSGLFGNIRLQPPGPDDGVYACTTEEQVYWNGENRGQRQTLELGEYVIAIDTVAQTSSSYEFGEGLSSGRKVKVEYRPGGLAQLVIRHADGKFTMRIALDATPMRFVGIGPYSVLSGTCVFQPQASR